MEAHHIADNQATRLVGKIEQEGLDRPSGQKIQVENLYKETLLLIM